jgi:plastocyanin
MLKWFRKTIKGMASIWTKCSIGCSLLCVLFFLPGCGNGEQKPVVQTNTVKQVPYQVYTVEIKEMKFVPDSISVKKGDEVVFVNRDMVPHCVTEEKDSAWSSSAIAPGESYLLVVKQSTDYYCAIHKVMKGKIVVN